MKRRVVIVDDHAPTRQWLAHLINQQSDLKVCGAAGNASEALRLIGSDRPHVVIVEISMEEGAGLELIGKIKAACPIVPEAAVLVLSVFDEVLYLERALRAGARGYVTKGEATANVLQAIRCVLEGKLYLSNRWTPREAEELRKGIPPGMESQIALLSQRELEVFELSGRCSGTRQIAAELQISYRTVQSYVARIKAKLKLANLNELLREAVRWHDAHNVK